MGVKNFLTASAKGIVKPIVSKDADIRNYYAKHYHKKIKKNTILYEVRDGQSIVDSPYTMFRYMVENSAFNNFHHIWVVANENNPIIQEIKNRYADQVEFVTRNSKKYVDWLLSAEYLINNATFQSFFSKKEGQVYINTWHGTPLKHMGFDIPGDPSHSQNVLRNFLMTDYLLSPNQHTTKIFSNSYRLEGIYSGTILEGGYPRIDNTFKTDPRELFNRLVQIGLEIDFSLPTILYTPTWKGTSVSNPLNDQQQIVQESLILKETFKGQYNFLIKVHPYIYESMKKDPRITSMLIPDYFDPNEILAGIDLLVTDYSSIFFDFLVTDRPIIFYAWDRDLYDADRGMYFNEEQLPGPITETITELIEEIKNFSKNGIQERPDYQKMKESVCFYDDGETTARYLARIFFGKASQKIKEYHLDSEKVKLLFYPGRMKNNGITTSFINLTNNLDYQKYDVSLLLARPTSDEEIQNLNKVNPHVRFLFRPGAAIYTRMEAIRNSWIQEFTQKKWLRSFYPEKAFQRETKRIVGGVHFDVAIDFSGYSFYWGKLISEMSANKKIVFQHNDLLADSQRTVNGVKPHEKNLNGIFSIYYRFDRLLSVSKETMQVNKEKLAEYIYPEQLGYTINTIDIEKILHQKLEMLETQDFGYEISNERSLASISSTGTFKIAKNITAIQIENFEERRISKESIIYVLATVSINNINYAKITLNGIYIGWIEKEMLISARVEEIKENSICKIGTIIGSKNGYIYNHIKSLEGIRSPLIYLEKTYALMTKKAVTNQGDFYLIENESGLLGWVDARYINNIHELKGFTFAKKIFYHRNQTQKTGITESYEVVHQRGTLIGKPEFCWSDPPNTTNSTRLQVDLSKFINSELSISKKAVVDKIEYIFFSIAGINGWIDAKCVSDIKDISNDSKISMERYEQSNTLTDIYGESISGINQENFNIITMGRLSPEKNQENLIKAFSAINKKFSQAKLYILGDGDLRNELLQTIFKLDLQAAVYMLGHKENPFDFMRQCDLFILPSIYEGQPMVLLEALTLGMPIVASDIPANRSVLGQEYGYYIEGLDTEAISKYLADYLDTKPKLKKFDARKYNEKAIKMFENELLVK